MGFFVPSCVSKLDPFKCRVARKHVDKVQPVGVANVPSSRQPAPRNQGQVPMPWGR